MDTEILLESAEPQIEKIEKKRGGGPRTPEGKARASMNSLKHGLRSEKTLLRHEDPVEYAAFIQSWFTCYDPQDNVARHLVDETAHAHWYLKRAQRRLADVEYELPSNAYHFTDEHHKILSNTLRYKTNYERSFFRFYKSLHDYYKRPVSQEGALEQAAIVEAQITQRVEIRADADNHPVCEFHPSNSDLAEAMLELPKPPLFVTRTIHFPDGIPHGYDVSPEDEHTAVDATTFTHRISLNKWLKKSRIEREVFQDAQPFNLSWPRPLEEETGFPEDQTI